MMFGFSSSRALVGIWSELRQLRRLAESYFRANDIPLPLTSYERLKARLTDSGHDSDTVSTGTAVTQPPTEQQLIDERIRQITEDRVLGRDPGTDYVPW